MTEKPDLASADLQAIAAAGQAVIRCSCGFVAMGADEGHMREAFEVHPCPNRTVDEQPRWWEAIFSLWGFLILTVVAYAVLAGIGKAQG